MSGMLPNRRVQVYDAEPIARSIRETFQARPVKERVELPFGWPRALQHVGDSVGVCYASDKWRDDGDYEIYKHIAESRNRVLSRPGFLHHYEEPSRGWSVVGPDVSFLDVPMPKEHAVLAYFEEANLILHSEGTDREPRFAGNPKDDVVVKVLIRDAVLGASKIRWSKLDPGQEDQPFLFVYTEPKGSDPGGVHLLVVGFDRDRRGHYELNVEKDGIVG